MPRNGFAFTVKLTIVTNLTIGIQRFRVTPLARWLARKHIQLITMCLLSLLTNPLRAFLPLGGSDTHCAVCFAPIVNRYPVTLSRPSLGVHLASTHFINLTCLPVYTLPHPYLSVLTYPEFTSSVSTLEACKACVSRIGRQSQCPTRHFHSSPALHRVVGLDTGQSVLTHQRAGTP